LGAALDNIGAMLHESPYRPSAAEFPHDNPMCDRGALWVGSELCWVAAAAEVDDVEIVALEPEGAAATETVIETATATTTATTTTTATATATATETTTTIDPDPANDDPIATFVRAVTEVALAYGPEDAAAHIASLFHVGTFVAENLSPTAQAALFEGNILEATDAGIRPTESFASIRTAWQGILRGESGDLAACGDSTLDTWTADLIARLVASPDKTSMIRRDLRRRGIAAFGMLS
jgi:hypothetical protein